MTSICVLGLGYIGLPTSALLASKGFRVYGVDIRPEVVRTVAAGQVHIREADLDRLVRQVVADGMLTAHAEPRCADVFIITVPTPLTKDRRPDLESVFSATRAIAPLLKRGDLVILESTCPVGTTRRIAQLMADERTDLVIAGSGAGTADVCVAYCPERVLPGRILAELIDNDRCVGGLTPACTERAAHLYDGFVKGEVLRTNAPTAELVKLSENAFRDVNIAFANELSMVADHHGIDVWTLIQLANRHPRVNILKPGPGVGGHCIAIDPLFIVDSAPEQARLIRVAREVNDRKADYVFEQISRSITPGAGADITCFGLAFKPNVDDLRESPALEIVERLGRAFPGRVAAVEPFISEAPAALRDQGVPLLGIEQALERPGVFVLLVDHTQFTQIPRERLLNHDILDTRGIWSRA